MNILKRDGGDMRCNIRVGALDWRDPAWSGSFYPADMPAEWRLSFYASQYNCVYLKTAIWQQADPAEFQQWSVDVHDQFVFLLEGEREARCPEALVHKARIVRSGDPCILWFDRGSDLKLLAAGIRADAGGEDLFLVSRDGDLAQMEKVTTLLELMGY